MTGVQTCALPIYPQKTILNTKKLFDKSKRVVAKTILVSMLVAVCLAFGTKAIAQQCTVGNSSTPVNFNATGSQVIGQSITTTCSGNMREATFHLPNATIGSTQTIYIKVYAGNGLSAPINPNAIPVSAVVNANHDAVIDFSAFPIAVAVSANTAYTFTAYQTDRKSVV